MDPAITFLADSASDRQEILDLLSPLLGADKANKLLTDFEGLIKTKAAEGTNNAIDSKMPEILTRVRSESGTRVVPVFAGVVVLSVIGIVISLIAIYRK